MYHSYTAIGDSITAGVGDDVGHLAVRSWTDWLADDLRATHPNLGYTNLGVGGSTTADVIHSQLAVAVGTRPELVSVTTGANDARRPDWTPAGFATEYERLVAVLAETGATVLTLAYPDIRPSLEEAGKSIPGPWEIYFERLHETNDVIRSVSASFGALVLDFQSYEPARRLEHLSADLTHPNALGYRKAGERALEVLTTQRLVTIARN